MKDKIYFSIIIPLYYKNTDYLSDLIDNIKEITCDCFECILVDGESINLKDYNLDSRFKIINIDSSDLSAKRNAGIQASKGDYIIFCDTDDLIAKDCLEKYKSILCSYSADFIISNVTTRAIPILNNCSSLNILNDKKKIENYFLDEYDTTLNIKKSDNFYKEACWGKLFKKSIILDNSIKFLTPTTRGEDVCFVLEYCKHVSTILFTNDYVAYFWRQNKNSSSHDLSSPFWNINLFADNILGVITTFGEKYLVGCKLHILRVLIEQTDLFLKNYINNNISYLFLSKNIHSFVPNNSTIYQLVCTSQLETYSKSDKHILKMLKKKKILLRYVILKVSKLIKKYLNNLLKNIAFASNK